MLMWLKDWLFSYNLKGAISKKRSQSATKSQNLSQFIGILYDETDLDSQSAMEKQIAQWQNKGRKVETFSYIDQKSFSEEENSDDRFCREHVNWYNVPKGEKVDSFMQKEYDLLISLNPKKIKHLSYLNAVSSAKFKIGVLPDDITHYNLLIDSHNPNSVKDFFIDLDTTLSKLTR